MVEVVADLSHPEVLLTQLQASLHSFSILTAQLPKFVLPDFRMQVSIHLLKHLMFSIKALCYGSVEDGAVFTSH